MAIYGTLTFNIDPTPLALALLRAQRQAGWPVPHGQMKHWRDMRRAAAKRATA